MSVVRLSREGTGELLPQAENGAVSGIGPSPGRSDFVGPFRARVVLEQRMGILLN